MTTKEDLKQEIDKLDGNCLDLVLRLLQQFPHQPESKHDPLNCSRPINYPDAETSDGLAFTDIEDAAVFGKQLRTSAWQRSQHG
ncbi:MAG: hypothetical protein ACXWE3_14610 [Methylobacter sp.]